MILVFLLCIIIVLFFIIIKYSCISIYIKNNLKEKNNNKNVEIKIGVGVLDFCFVRKKLNKEQLMKYMTNKKTKEIFDKNNLLITLKIIRKKIIRLENLDLKLWIGTGDYVLDAYLMPVISLIISYIILNAGNQKKLYGNNYKYSVNSIYNDFFFKMEINCIIRIKLVHIIYILFLIWKGSRKYERSSNRKPYGYSYEQH